jgi:hypothetical protein
MSKLLAALIFIAVSGSAIANSCGYPPYPPYGCKVGPCVCDEKGQNCHYIMIC